MIKGSDKGVRSFFSKPNERNRPTIGSRRPSKVPVASLPPLWTAPEPYVGRNVAPRTHHEHQTMLRFFADIGET
jgi:hypothetical protein